MSGKNFEAQHQSFGAPAKSRARTQERDKVELPPQPQELFFEAGLVLAVALGAAWAVQLIFGS